MSKNAVAKAIQVLLELLPCKGISVQMNKCLVKEQKGKISFVNRMRSLLKYHIILLVSSVLLNCPGKRDYFVDGKPIRSSQTEKLP